MTNYEKRLKLLTIDELIQLENTVHDCDETRKKWLASDEK